MPRGKGRGKNKRGNTGDDSFEMPTTVEGIMELLQNVQNMHPAQLMKLQASLDDPSQVPPFPSNKVNRCLKRVSAITNYEDLKLDDVSQLQSWCKEDFYMESIFDAGVVPVLAHILNLCKSYASERVTKKITSKLTSTQNRKLELTLYSIADGLLNENNKQKTDLSEVVPLLISFIHQEGDIGKGFPLTVTAMNYAIKALGETYRALAIQKEEGLANLIADDTQLLEIVRVYIRNDQISTPIGMKVSSLLCSLRFVQMLAMTSPKCLHTMAALGYRETLQAITANDTQTSVIIENTLGLFQGEFKFDVPVEAGAYHTKKQLKRLCAYCGIEENPTEPHKKCSRCKRRHYCSRQCQVDHWKAAHSQECASCTK